LSVSFVFSFVSPVLMSFRYQFNPDLFNPDVVVNILVKALASVPFPDFNLSVALLDDRALSPNAEEPDPLPSLLPYLINMHGLLQQCRFPAFWTLYRSDDLESLRDNYTVEVVGFEDSIREVAVRAVKATFQKIGSKRLGSYLDLEGDLANCRLSFTTLIHVVGEELEEYISRLGWKIDSTTGVVEVPPNPDNQIASTVVQEDIKLQRKFSVLSVVRALLTANNRTNKSYLTRNFGGVGRLRDPEWVRRVRYHPSNSKSPY
jgi:translation initiation factor 3 subunit K